MKEMSTATAPETPAAQGWKDRGIEALIGLAESNPQIVERLSGTLERIVGRVLPLPNEIQPYPPQYLPQIANATAIRSAATATASATSAAHSNRGSDCRYDHTRRIYYPTCW